MSADRAAAIRSEAAILGFAPSVIESVDALDLALMVIRFTSIPAELRRVALDAVNSGLPVYEAEWVAKRAAEAVPATYQGAAELVAELSDELGVELRLGYIGNLAPGRDDRVWDVCFHGFGNVPRSVANKSRGPWSHRASGTSYPATRSWTTNAFPSLPELAAMIRARHELAKGLAAEGFTPRTAELYCATCRGTRWFTEGKCDECAGRTLAWSDDESPAEELGRLRRELTECHHETPEHRMILDRIAVLVANAACARRGS